MRIHNVMSVCFHGFSVLISLTVWTRPMALPLDLDALVFRLQKLGSPKVPRLKTSQLIIRSAVTRVH